MRFRSLLETNRWSLRRLDEDQLERVIAILGKAEKDRKRVNPFVVIEAVRESSISNSESLSRLRGSYDHDARIRLPGSAP